MPKRKLQKTNKTSRITARRTRQKRLLFVVAFALVSVPAGWLAVSAQSAPDGPAVLEPAAISQPSSTLGASAASKASSKVKRADDLRPQAKDKNASTASNKASQASSSAKAGASKSNQSVAAAAATSGSAGSVASATSAKTHQGIITTIFWAGEAADANNANISNVPSAWDEAWQQHYGGYDDPDHRNGYLPAGFTPLENPFYFALPYNDYDENGKRKASASQCSAITGVNASTTSWCKNAWIKIDKGGKSAYAQWQDVGPLQEDDTNYVFGTAKPINTWGAKAGLDVSPAVRDYLGLKDVDSTNWTFVSASAVPAGPWKQIVTTSGVYWQ